VTFFCLGSPFPWILGLPCSGQRFASPLEEPEQRKHPLCNSVSTPCLLRGANPHSFFPLTSPLTLHKLRPHREGERPAPQATWPHFPQGVTFSNRSFFLIRKCCQFSRVFFFFFAFFCCFFLFFDANMSVIVPFLQTAALLVSGQAASFPLFSSCSSSDESSPVAFFTKFNFVVFCLDTQSLPIELISRVGPGCGTPLFPGEAKNPPLKVYPKKSFRRFFSPRLFV